MTPQSPNPQAALELRNRRDPAPKTECGSGGWPRNLTGESWTLNTVTGEWSKTETQNALRAAPLAGRIGAFSATGQRHGEVNDFGETSPQVLEHG